MPTLTTPEHGARFQFVLQQQTEASARYAVEVFLPDSTILTFELEILREDRSTTGERTGVDARPNAAWLHKQLDVVARGIAKNARWPRRITRWKPGE